MAKERHREKERQKGRNTQPPFNPSVGSLCHFCVAPTHLSYRFPFLKLPPPPCAVLLVYLCWMGVYRGKCSPMNLETILNLHADGEQSMNQNLWIGQWIFIRKVRPKWKKKHQKWNKSMKQKLPKGRFQLGLLPTQKPESRPLRGLLDRHWPPYCLRAGDPRHASLFADVCRNKGRRWLTSSRGTTCQWCWANCGRQRTGKQQPGITSHFPGSSIGTS